MRAGNQAVQTRLNSGVETTVPTATKWTSGRALNSISTAYIRRMFAQFKVRPPAKGHSVVTRMQIRSTMESVTRMVVTSTLTAWETSPF